MFLDVAATTTMMMTNRKNHLVAVDDDDLVNTSSLPFPPKLSVVAEAEEAVVTAHRHCYGLEQ
jgi:hypothetical protein